MKALQPRRTLGREWRAGWRTVLGAGLGLGTGAGFNYYLSSLFISPLGAEFGWSRGEITRGSGFFLVIALLAIPLGRLTDRIGVRPVILVSTLGFAGAFFGLASQSGSLIAFYGWIIMLNVFSFGTSVMLWTKPVSAKFDCARGSALSVSMVVIPIAALLLSAPFAHLIATYGWRMGYVVLGFGALAGGLTGLALIGVQRHDRDVDRHAPNLTMVPPGRGRQLAMLCAALLIYNLPAAGILSQLAPILVDLSKRDATSIAWLLAAMPAAVIVGRLGSGFLLDRYPAKYVAIAIFIGPALGCIFMLASSGNVPLLMAGVALCGLAQGAEGDFGAFLIARNFGMESFAGLSGIVTFFNFGGHALGALTFGIAYDKFGSYNPMLTLGSIEYFVAAVLLYWVAHHPRAAASTDEQENHVSTFAPVY